MRHILIPVLLLLTSLLTAGVVDYHVRLDNPVQRDDGTLEGQTGFTMAEPGQPMLPFEGYQILLPYGTEVSDVEVYMTDWTTLPGDWEIEPMGEPAMLSQPTAAPVPDPAIYNLDSFWAPADYELVMVGRLAGMDIAIINVYPYRYNPVQRSLGFFSDVQISVHTQSNAAVATQQSRMTARTPSVMQRINALTVNPEMAETYPSRTVATPSRDLVDINDPHNIIIICTNAFQDQFNEYATWIESHGWYQVGVFTLEDILSEYSASRDDPESMRDFIADAFNVYGSTSNPLMYVLLAGDDEIMPYRGVYANAGGGAGDTYYDMPCDMYFGCLDGDWNNDGDQVYGEPNDDPDLLAEVHVGRFPCETEEEFGNLIYKTQQWMDFPASGRDRATMVGQNLDDTPTWGGDYKDEIADNPIYLPSYFHTTKYYEMDGSYSTSGLIEHINNGFGGIMNNMSHGLANSLMDLNGSDFDSMTNTEYAFLYSQACLALGFDESNGGPYECVGEHAVFAEGGLFAYVGNTREGWYVHGSTNGASQQFDKKYFYGLYSENIREMGAALSYSKESLVHLVNSGSGTYRWVMYEIILAGDPHIRLDNAEGDMPDLELFYNQASEHGGDGDGYINPGEEVEIMVMLLNDPEFGTANNVSIQILPNPEYYTIEYGMLNYGTVLPGDPADNYADPFIVQLRGDCPNGPIEYYFRVIANEGTDAYFIKDYQAFIDVSMYHQGFPLELGVTFNSAPIVVDMDNDGTKDIINGSTNGEIHAIDLNGDPLSGFPVSTGQNIRSSIAMGQLDADDEWEIVSAGYSGDLIATDHNGGNIFTRSGFQAFLGTPALNDINGDGVDEIIVGNLNGSLYVVDATGNDVAGFPAVTGGALVASPAIGDIDGDGADEILIGSNDGSLYAWEFDGSVVAGYPLALQGSIKIDPVIFDGKIAIATDNNWLNVIENGTAITQVELSNKVSKNIIPVDFDLSGDYEIAFVLETGIAYIMDTDGTIWNGWPKELGVNVKGSPAAGDLESDGIPELVIMDQNGNIHGFNPNGTHAANFPIMYGISSYSSVALSDIDMDGTAEIAAGTNSGISVWDIKYSSANLNFWGMYRGNPRRSGNLADVLDAQPDGTVPAYVTSLDQNYPNPFNPTTTIRFTLSEEDSHNPVSVHIYNIRGQMIRTLVPANLEAGVHTLTWNGDDHNGNRVSSGMYFYRLNNTTVEHTRKMLLLK